MATIPNENHGLINVSEPLGRKNSAAYLSSIPAGFQLERLSWWTIQFYTSVQSPSCLFCCLVVDCLYVPTFEASWCCSATNVKGVPMLVSSKCRHANLQHSWKHRTLHGNFGFIWHSSAALVCSSAAYWFATFQLQLPPPLAPLLGLAVLVHSQSGLWSGVRPAQEALARVYSPPRTCHPLHEAPAPNPKLAQLPFPARNCLVFPHRGETRCADGNLLPAFECLYAISASSAKSLKKVALPDALLPPSPSAPSHPGESKTNTPLHWQRHRHTADIRTGTHIQYTQSCTHTTTNTDKHTEANRHEYQ